MQAKRNYLQQSATSNDNKMLLYQYCKEIDNWAKSWEITDIDLVSGQAIVDEFKLFLLDSIQKGKSKRIIKNYAGYLWALGGVLIDNLYENKNERKLAARKLILKYIDNIGGPYWRHAYDESEHSKYDSVCRQLFKFMTQNSH